MFTLWRRKRGNPRSVFLLSLTKRFLLCTVLYWLQLFFSSTYFSVSYSAEWFMFVQNVEYLIIEDLCVPSKTLQTVTESLLQSNPLSCRCNELDFPLAMTPKKFPSRAKWKMAEKWSITHSTFFLQLKTGLVVDFWNSCLEQTSLSSRTQIGFSLHENLVKQVGLEVD